MKKRLLAILGVVALISSVFFSTEAMAQGRIQRRANSHIDAQQNNQQKRIEQGISSGRITAHEADRLRQQQESIRQQEALAKQNGRLSDRERFRLNRQINKSSGNIYKQNHDSQKIYRPRTYRNK